MEMVPLSTVLILLFMKYAFNTITTIDYINNIRFSYLTREFSQIEERFLFTETKKCAMLFYKDELIQGVGA